MVYVKLLLNAVLVLTLVFTVKGEADGEPICI